MNARSECCKARRAKRKKKVCPFRQTFMHMENLRKCRAETIESNPVFQRGGLLRLSERPVEQACSIRPIRPPGVCSSVLSNPASVTHTAGATCIIYYNILSAQLQVINERNLSFSSTIYTLKNVLRRQKTAI